jgi:hypothetical protein
MYQTIRLQSSEIALSTANTVNNSKAVRVLETGTGNALITHKDAGGNTIGTITIRQGNEFYFRKDPTDTLTSNSATTVAVAVSAW